MFFRQLLFLALLVTTGCIIFFKIKFFVGAFLGAIVLYVVFRGFLFRLTERYGWRRWVASGTILAIIVIITGGLGFLIFKMTSAELSKLDAEELISDVRILRGKVNDFIGFDLIPSDFLEESESILKNVLIVIFNTTYSFTLNILTMIFILYFMFASGRKMEASIMKYIPFEGESLCLLKRETNIMIFNSAVIIPLMILAQTVVSAFIYWFAGLSNFFFWAFLTALAALLPVVGCMIIYVPISIYLMVEVDFWTGMTVLIYGMTVISLTDNILRMIFMKNMSNTHPLVVIFGIIIGIPLFGFWGIIFGPLMLSAFMLLIRIYYVEYGLIDRGNDGECRSDEAKVNLKFNSKLFRNFKALWRRERLPESPDGEISDGEISDGEVSDGEQAGNGEGTERT